MSRLKIIFLCELILLSSGCESFLENIDPPKLIPGSTVFANDFNATSAVTGIYENMYRQGFASGFSGSVTDLAGLSPDELRILQNTNVALLEFERNVILSSNEYPNIIWQSLYSSVYGANAALEGLNNSSGVTPEVKDQLMGEAFFVRAFCHFYLVNLFGDVPLVTTTDYKVNAVVQRSDTDLVYDQIVEDLLRAKELLTAKYPSGERVRPNRSTATALLARVYLYLEEWQNAEVQSTEIIDNTEMYELVSLDEVFLKNNREAIWQFSLRNKQINTNEGETFAANLSLYVLTDTLINSFEPLDSRQTKWVGSNGLNYYPHKYKYIATTPGALATEYSVVFRLAEQYLIRAEARARQNNLTGLNSASSDVDMIRNRAGLGDLPAEIDTEAEVMLAIEQERRTELFTEWGHRWFDLKRWGLAAEVLGPQKNGFSENDLLYPIPVLEIHSNPSLTQNPGY